MSVPLTRRLKIARVALMRRLAAALSEWSLECARLAEGTVPADAQAAKSSGSSKPRAAWTALLSHLDSPDLATRMLDSGVLGDDLPRAQGIPAGRRILVLAAHQDDEIIGAGGTFLLCRMAGATFRVMYSTDGATRLGPEDPAEIARWRRDEATAVWTSLAGVEPVFLDYPSRTQGIPAEGGARLAAEIQTFDPDTIFLPVFFEQPTEHRRVNDLLLAAHRIRPIGKRVEVWGYQITTRLPGNRVVDVTQVWKRKYALNARWATQNAYRDYAYLAMGRDISNSYYLKGAKYPRRAKAHAELFLAFDARAYLEMAATFSDVGRTASGAEAEQVAASAAVAVAARGAASGVAAGAAAAGSVAASTVAGGDVVADTGDVMDLTATVAAARAAAPPPPDFFVIGMQKSGSYWLTALLDAHPVVRCFPPRPGRADGTGEAHLFDILARLDTDFAGFRKSMKGKLDGYFADIVPARAPATAGERDLLVERLRARFNRYCDEQRTKSGKPVVGEKTTETVHYPALVDALYPGVRKVCILRDPRDRAVSFFFHQQRKGRTAPGAHMSDDLAREYVARVRQDYEGLVAMPGPLHVLTYERLSADPHGTVTALLTFLGVDASPDTVARVVAAGAFDALAGRAAGEADPGNHFRQGRPGDWRNHLSLDMARWMPLALEDVTRAVEEKTGLDLYDYRSVGTPADPGAVPPDASVDGRDHAQP
ncbi:MAG: hypothetical protein HOP14_01500 [Acidobacteria bacterium]|nr:hypothetical protein [Acidobacteriota bacterium]